MSTVLVTGGSGFIGGHCILQLLSAGHRVRTTVRDLKREAEVRAALKGAGAEANDRLSFHAADLQSDAGWKDAVAGCEYALHVASPLPTRAPKHEDELIVPAREGTLRVLRVSRDAGVKRVVITSSIAAISYGHAPRAEPFNESDWTNLDTPGLAAYTRSKTLAERAAWDFMAREGGALELATVNPVVVLGPVLSADLGTSVEMVRRFMIGAIPASPLLYFNLVDVRDVADLHLRAMTHPAAAGERFIASSGDALTMREIAQILKRRLGPAGKRVRTLQMPNWLMRTVARFSPTVRQLLPELGKVKNATSAKAQRVLGWTPRSSEEAIVSAAESLLRVGVVR